MITCAVCEKELVDGPIQRGSSPYLADDTVSRPLCSSCYFTTKESERRYGVIQQKRKEEMGTVAYEKWNNYCYLCDTTTCVLCGRELERDSGHFTLYTGRRQSDVIEPVCAMCCPNAKINPNHPKYKTDNSTTSTVSTNTSTVTTTPRA